MTFPTITHNLIIDYLTISLIVLPVLSIIYTIISIQYEKKIINNVLSSFAALEIIICTGLLIRGGGGMFYNFEFDFTALLYIWLTIFVIQLCTIVIPSERNNDDMVYFLILVIKLPLMLFFSTTHLVTFYICFESVLFPLFFLIASYGSRPQRIPAAYKLFFYTVLSSFLMFFVFIYIYIKAGSLSMQVLFFFPLDFTTECLLWFALFFPLAVKTPLFPFHSWLPEAHVEAPTIGSVILAALILKMSLFGFIHVLFPLCPIVSRYMAIFVCIFCFVGSIFVGLSALYYTDLKKIIAASSIVHMSYAVIGLFSFNSLTISASIYAMFAHGLISSALFFSIGSLYNRYYERDLSFFSNLMAKMPDLGFSFFFLSFANAAFPATIGYLPEVMILVASTEYSVYMPFVLLFPLFINGAYNIWAITRLCFGPERAHQVIEHLEPLNFGELFSFYTCFLLIMLLGFHPSFIIENISHTLIFLNQ